MHMLPSSSMPSSGTVSSILRQGYSLIKEGKLTDALRLMEEALSIDFDSQEVIVSLKYVNYWLDRLNEVSLDNLEAFEYGRYLVEQWRAFTTFIDQDKGFCCEDALFAIKFHIFTLALNAFLQYTDSQKDNSELCLNIARCYRNIGKSDDAVQYLKRALNSNKQSAPILAELADLYALMGELNSAKALFREAFFINPQEINCDLIESELFTRLSKQVQKIGYTGKEVNEWVPVYGALYGVFSVKRDLKPVEFGQLQQSVYQIEHEIKQTEKEARKLLVPRLINRYFWLIDQFVRMSQAQEKIDAILLKIRNLSPEIYRQYAG